MLKLNFPDTESQFEADALNHWRADGVVRLLENDADRNALLLERCIPGTPLWDVAEEDGNRIAAALLRRLWRPPPKSPRFRHLSDQAMRWAEQLPRDWEAAGTPFENALIDRAVEEVNRLVPTQTDMVLLHQDFHGGNVLRSQREPWLVIDPKPLVGEREFDAASLLRDRRAELTHDPDPQRRIRRRLDQLAAELNLDRERLRGWGIVHALAWGFDAPTRKVESDMIACARWLVAA